ncbi:MAG: ABC transporter permease [Clostridiales bacterium]|nr:ABC transporter permease [Clostridiales bacterium]MDY2657922.1 ABC transporter permease [Candidatus Limiplasma sp.]
MSKKKVIGFVAKYGSAILMLGAFLYFSIRIPDIWLTSYMLSSIVEQSVSLGLVALGLTIVSAHGEMDMSIGSVVSLGAMLSMMCIASNRPIWTAVLLTVVCGAAIGVVNGFMRTKMRIPGMIPTIGMQSAIAGVALMVNNGNMIYGSGEHLKAYTQMGRGYIGAISVPALIFVAIALVVWFVMAKMKQGRLFYMIGGNADATALSGVKVNRQVLKGYVFCAILGALAGVMASARSGSGNPEAGVDLFLDGLIAVTLGSTLLTDEREYRAVGSIVGALFITMMINGLQLIGQGNHMQCIMRGVLLLLGLVLSSLRSIAAE